MLNMKSFVACIVPFFIFAQSVLAEKVSVKSPDGRLEVEVAAEGGLLNYNVKFKGERVLENSPLGFSADIGDFKSGLSFKKSALKKLSGSYKLRTIKKSKVNFSANELTVSLENSNKHSFDVIFRVSDNNVAFRYFIPKAGEAACIRIFEENSGFKFPLETSTFMSEQMLPMHGWKRSTPSYEAVYHANAPLSKISGGKNGWIMPALFNVKKNYWVLVAESGVGSNYCASKLGEVQNGDTFKIAFPNPMENNGNGTVEPAFSLPNHTPWRTITVGDSLKPIVETTITWDVVKPLYEPEKEYKYGRSTWSWIVWQDPSMNWDDQVKFIDLASEMKFEYILIDAGWDVNIGYEKISDLIKYANSKNVDVLLWYSSSGYWNDIAQTPVNKMDNSIIRKREMKWLKKANVKGIKVDFFGGDKQETMRLYEQILSDANDNELMVFFHGTTMPRGWERMYPNYVGSEAVIASEALIFGQWACDNMSYFASMHPFIRNTAGSMEFGGTFLNKRLNRGNDGGTIRRTGDAAELAVSVLFQNPIQALAITPNNLSDAPKACIDFLKNLPTVWDETVFIDGYPGKYCVLARRSGKDWYVAGICASKEGIDLALNLPMLKGKKARLLSDAEDLSFKESSIKIPQSGIFKTHLKFNGGFVISTK